MDEKIRFIEEVKIEKELLEDENNFKKPNFVHSNPIRANLMKFVHLKLGRSANFKKDFE